KTDVRQAVDGLLALVRELDVVGGAGGAFDADLVHVTGEPAVGVCRRPAQVPLRRANRLAGAGAVRARGDLHAVAIEAPDAGVRGRAVVHARQVNPLGAVGILSRELRGQRDDVRGAGPPAR